MKQPVKRRQPQQGRAQQTRLLIFETAVRILERHGLEGLTTNRIAELSGFSVGTLYQYFANKQEILQALARHERDKRLAEIRHALLASDLQNDAPYARIRTVVRSLLNAFDGRQRARRILVELALQSGRQNELERPVNMLATLLSSGEIREEGDGERVSLSSVDAFVLTQAVAGAIRAALASDQSLLKKPAFEDALVELIAGFLQTRMVLKR